MLRALLTALLLAVPCLAAQAQTGRALPLIGGEDAGAGWPWMAAVLEARDSDPYTAQFCGATVIAPAWALTAAHCVHDHVPGTPFAMELDLLSGSGELRKGLGTRHEIVEIIVHPGFVPPAVGRDVEFDNDIALLRLDPPADGLQPVDLPGYEFDVMAVKAGTMSTVLGWGAVQYDNESRSSPEFPRDLKKVGLPVAGADDCMEVMGAGEVTVNMFCAGNLLDLSDSCVGDSGGPLVVPADSPSGYRQAGIISWGLGCGQAGFYGVYTRLGRFANWISSQVCRPEELPARPSITSLSSGNGRVALSWSSAGAGVRYRLYYAPAPHRSPIRHFDVGTQTSFSTEGPAGVAFEVAIQAYRGPCTGRFSAIRQFTL